MRFIDMQPPKIEFLPTEIFLDIFALFSLEEIVNSFCGLNSYIDSIIRCITSASHTISSNDTKAAGLLSLYPNQIGRLFITRGVTIDFTSLINLRSLTIEYGTIAQLNGIRTKNFPMLEMLHIYGVNSNSLTDERKSLDDLFQVILSNGFPHLRICTTAGIESLDWSETWTGSPTLRILILDVRTPIAYQKLLFACPNLRLFKSHSLSLSLSSSNYISRKRLLTEITRLKQWESEKKFILEDCSFFYTNSKTAMPVIRGRILPEKDPYCFASFRIEIRIPIEYPFKAPEATILDPIYHPSVLKGGEHCCCWGFNRETWHPRIMLIEFITGMIKVIDRTDLDWHGDKRLADEYQNNYDRFYEKALQCTLNKGRPRY